MEITKKMQLFEIHQGACRTDWHKVMEDVYANFWKMWRRYQWKLDDYMQLFVRCMLKWCVEEDGSINRDFVDILTDVEIHMVDGNVCNNIDHLLPMMAKACLHVFTADSSPPHFNISYDSLEDYVIYLALGNRECRNPASGKISIQITKVRDLTTFIKRSRDKINHENEKVILISLESLYDKVACHVHWDNTYLSEPNTDMDTFFNAWIRKISALPLEVAIWTEEILKTSIDYVTKSLKQLHSDQDIDLTLAVKDQLKMLCGELKIIVYVHTNWEGPNLVDERVEVQALARSVESICFLYFSTQHEDINIVVAAAAEKASLGIRNMLASIIKYRAIGLTMHVPLPHELLFKFMKYVQRVMSLMPPNTDMDTLFNAWIRKISALPLEVAIWTDEILKTSIDYVQKSLKQLHSDQDIDLTHAVKDQLKMLCRELEIILNFHTDWEGPNLVDDDRVEVQALARSVESLCFLYFSTQHEDINIVVAAAAEKASLGIRNMLASIIKYRAIGLTMPVPLPHELLFKFMENIKRVMSQALENKDFIWTNAVKDQLEMLHNDLIFFVNFHVDYPLGYYAEPGELQTVASNLESFIFSFITQTKNIKLCSGKVIIGLHNLLVSVLRTCILQLTSCAILPLSDEFLLQFMECVQRFLSRISKGNNIVPPGPLGVQLEFLRNEMGNLVEFHINYFPAAVRMEVQTVVMNTASLIIQAKQDATDIIPEVRNLLASILTAWVVQLTISFPHSDLAQKISHLNVEDIVFLIIVCKLSRVTPPRNQLGFFNCLLDNMKGSVYGGEDLGEFQTIHEALLLLRDFLQSMTTYSIAYTPNICERVLNVAYEAEYLTYSLDDGSYSASCRSLWIYHFAQHVELTCGGSMGDQNHVSSQVLTPITDLVVGSEDEIIDLVVGFEDEMKHVKQKLVASHHVKQLDVVSIIGMPGLGKTTLARKVYEDRQIANHFEIRAWCVVSNEYNKKDLLLTILGCMIKLTDLIQKSNEAELSTLLYQQLIGRRYLVVMDDVWGIDAFEFLKVYLPENTNGSRILLTSRNKVIGLKVKRHSDILDLRLLTDDESWDLLSKKVYRNQECPSKLCQVGKRIAESCRGLPLAVVVVAGLLAKSHKTRKFWEQVAENLSSYISNDSQAQGIVVLELSYKHLPRHLKPLFLYIGAFPEDREIPVENLIWLWIAEGFVRDNMLGSLEHQAELYLMDLIDRSFLMVSARRSNGRVKTCIVHDLLRDMCLLKAKEEHLLQQVNVSDDLPDPILYQKRLSVLLQRKKEGTPTHLFSNIFPTKPFVTNEDISTLSLTPLYSFLFFNKNQSLPLWKEVVASVLCDLKLLRILHFESSSIDANLCGDVMMLVHLRYISIRVVWNAIPSSISKLRNLETLIIKGLRGEIEISEEIWELVMLRHIHVNDRAKFNYSSDKLSMLKNLETLSTPALRRVEEVKLMKRLPNVRKLRCIFLESCPQLKSPNQLESLKAIYTGVGRCPGTFVVPLTLKKLSLSKFRLKWEQVSVFQKLPVLEILNLRIGAVDGESWNMDEEEEEGFLKLKVLKLESLNLKRWTACDNNFPCLEKLVIKKCKQLVEIPSELGGINCLKKMEVLWCSKSAAISAKSIEEEQTVAGNESLEVHIYPANLGSSS